MEEKIEAIKKWLGTGSINIFGLPMSGKDTVGIKLAEMLGARFLSSGIIIRAMEQEQNQHYTDSGQLIPNDVFYKWVLPYFSRSDLADAPLVLSSVGRWSGEENYVMNAAEDGGHPIKAVVVLNISEADVTERWNIVREQGVRESGEITKREDDKRREVFDTRIKEFNEKTVPVLKHYQELGLLVPVQADMTREEVLNLVVEKLYEYSLKN